MSIPASSCSFSVSNVASRLASASSSPVRRHGAHSIRGWASQAGFGMEPAMVVSNIATPQKYAARLARMRARGGICGSGTTKL